MRVSAAALVGIALASVVGESPQSFEMTATDMKELESILKRDHAEFATNVFDKDNQRQFTWNVERQELCEGKDGSCVKDEV